MFVDRKKKLNKSKNLIKTIKTEPQDLQALGHYIEDPDELLQQAFQCLKSKTIKSLSPDLFQKFTIDEVQQFCLDELMGISKKRLLSIINGTKCPSDTDDSDDSDVQDIEEHVSLEEISSDSDVGSSKKKKKIQSTNSSVKVNKKNKTGGNLAGIGDSKKSDKVTGTTGGGAGGGAKQMSVLELLELQARARAIRSQLALEPITKIELDSENDEKKVNISAGNNIATIKTNQTDSVKTKIINRTKNVGPTVKPIRLKRNFRQRQNGSSDEEETIVPPIDNKNDDNKIITKSNDEDKKTAIDEIKVVEKIIQPQEIKNKLPTTINDDNAADDNIVPDTNKENSLNADDENETKERSPSPDLITIVPSPETFCISSESENEDMEFLKTIKNKGKYIDYNAIVVKNKQLPTEDELFLNKIKQTTMEKLLAKSNNDDKVENDTFITEDTINSEVTVAKDHESEQEEGELTSDNEDQDMDDSDKKENALNKTVISNDESLSKSANTDDGIVDLSGEINQEQHPRPTEDNENETNGENTDNDSSDSNKSTPTKVITVSTKLNDENIEIINDDDDEDVIDLGKDEEIDEFDLSKEESPRQIEPTTTTPTDKAEETTENDSWGARWLRGRNVAKVLATSRIGNKVRSKIKQTKKNKAAALESKNSENKLNEENDKVLDTETAAQLLNNDPAIEVGSVEHYENLQAATIDLKKKD